MVNLVTADLRTYRHFFSPGDEKHGHQAPSLTELIRTWHNEGLGIVSLSANHSGTGGIDNSWRDYRKQIPTLSDVQVDDRSDEGYMVLTQIPLRQKIIVVNSQVVRAYDGEHPVHINVLGVPEILNPGKQFQETIEEARKYDGIVLLSNVGDRSGLPIAKAEDLYLKGTADGVEVSAEARPKITQKILERLVGYKRKPVAVSGAHSHNLAGTSCILVDENLVTDFSIPYLKDVIVNGEFNPHLGQISLLQRFWTRDRYILQSALPHILSKEKREEFLRATGIKK
ncbi:MAG: hypothetical protein Q8P57_03965 [Candidatus Pacearchaeota archaeon]|nr:hypothetical protein [Candidatus Pacearchaeota archaeon]